MSPHSRCSSAKSTSLDPQPPSPMRPTPPSDHVYSFSSPTGTVFFCHRPFRLLHTPLPPQHLFHLNISPPLLIDPTLYSTDFNNKNHQPVFSPSVNTIHPIISSHRLFPPLLPTTTHSPFGTRFHVPPTLLYAHNIPIPSHIWRSSSFTSHLEFGLDTTSISPCQHSHWSCPHFTIASTFSLHYLFGFSLTTTMHPPIPPRCSNFTTTITTPTPQFDKSTRDWRRAVLMVNNT